jgi:tetratricopeptide (TPR) repeat protein
LQRAESHLGPDDRLAAIAMALLGETLQTTGKHDEARELLTRAIGIQSAELGSEHPEVLNSLNNLAASYQAEGNLEQAEKLILQVYAARQSTLSATSPEFLGSLNQLASLYYQQGDFAKAAPFFEKIVKVLPEVLPEHHPAFARYHGNYGACLGKLGQMEDAEEHVLLAYQTINDSLGPDNESTLFYLKNVHGFYWSWGKIDKAEKHHRMFVRSILRTVDHDKSGRDSAGFWIDQLELKLRKFDRELDRDALYHELIAYAEQHLAPGQRQTGRYLGNLGTILFDVGEFKLAESSLLQCYNERLMDPGIDHPETRWALQKLIKLYKTTGQEAKAVELGESLGNLQSTES